MQGTQLLKELGETMPKMVKVMIMGYLNLENAVESINYGVDAYLIKP